MGMTDVKLKITSIENSSKSIEGKFMVDSGSQYTVIPYILWQKLGLKPKRKQEFSLADGSIISRKLSDAFVEYQGLRAATPIVLGEKKDDALLGVFTLESMGLTLDPFTRTLHKTYLRM